VRPSRDFRLGTNRAPSGASGCITTALWTGAGVRFEARHLARLARDAASLGLGSVDTDLARRALRELGLAAFGEDAGVLRLTASRGADGALAISATPRSVGPTRPGWHAALVPIAHDGRAAPHGAKLADRALYTRAAEYAGRAGADEGLLLDPRGRLVEGSRSNLVAVGDDGVARVPPVARGAVAGIALEACEAGAKPGELVRRDVARSELARLRELVALNAVRGVVAITRLDGNPVGDGRPGPVSARLTAILDAQA